MQPSQLCQVYIFSISRMKKWKHRKVKKVVQDPPVIVHPLDADLITRPLLPGNHVLHKKEGLFLPPVALSLPSQLPQLFAMKPSTDRGKTQL